jgi:hypothetical protein
VGVQDKNNLPEAGVPSGPIKPALAESVFDSLPLSWQAATCIALIRTSSQKPKAAIGGIRNTWFGRRKSQSESPSPMRKTGSWNTSHLPIERPLLSTFELFRTFYLAQPRHCRACLGRSQENNIPRASANFISTHIIPHLIFYWACRLSELRAIIPFKGLISQPTYV